MTAAILDRDSHIITVVVVGLPVLLVIGFSQGCGDRHSTSGDAGTETAMDPMIDAAGEADAAAEPVEDPVPDPALDPVDDPGPEPGEDPAPEPVDDPADDPEPDPVDDPEPDPVGDPPVEPFCTPVGCPLLSTSTGCCGSLSLGTGCEPGVPCSTYYCVDRTDGLCRSHESAWDTPCDCPTGCTPGTVENMVCPGVGTMECTCVEDPCEPRCDLDGLPPDGWLDGCTGSSMASCSDVTMTAQCLYIDTRSEGWYEPPDSGGRTVLIDYDTCAPRWSCVVL